MSDPGDGDGCGTGTTTPVWERVIRTLVVSDLVGSTGLVERLGDVQAAELFGRHDRIARDLLRNQGGIEIDKTDGFLLVFERPLDAVLYAVAYHRGLTKLQVGLGARLEARLGIHLAEVLLARNSPADVERGAKPVELEGLAKPFTARLMSVALAGQTLLSSTAFDLARRAAVGHPEANALRWLRHGPYLFKGVDGPVEVYEAGVEGEAPLCAPLGSEKVQRLDAVRSTPSDPSGLRPKGPPTNLPAAVNPLLGRESESATIHKILCSSDARLVTLIGPGGIGKTHLAVEVARGLTNEFVHGTFLVSLASIQEPELLVAAVISALGLAPGAGAPAEQLKRYLRERRLLLVLDNFEHLVDAAPVVSQLLSACPSLKVLVTSRVVLRLSGEHEFAVPALELPSAVREQTMESLASVPSVALFLQRAEAVAGRRDLSESDIRAVAEICLRLDGLPLAIELAAARSKLIPPRKMVAKLQERLGILVGGARDLPARQQTMRAAIGWSHDLLSDEEKKLFRRLSVFAGGWSLEAAEYLADGSGDLGPDVLEGLGSLVDKSLVRQSESKEGEPRFFMFETIREYAAERLSSSGEELEIRRLHAAFFASLAESAELELRGSQQIIWYDRLEAEHPNLRAALDFCSSTPALVETGLRMGGALWWFWWRRGYPKEGKGRLERLLEAGRASEDTVGRAKALCGLGSLTDLLGDSEASWRRLEESIAVARRLGDRRVLAVALMQSSWPLASLDLRAAVSATEEGLRLFLAAGDRWGTATALNYQGEFLRAAGDLRQAAVAYEKSVALNREIGNSWVLATSTHNLAATLRRLGNAERAPALLRESVCTARQIRSPSLDAMVLLDLAGVALQEGAPARAARLIGAAERIEMDTGLTREVAEREEYDRIVGLTGELLSPDEHASAWAEGKSMTRDAALTLALETGPGVLSLAAPDQPGSHSTS